MSGTARGFKLIEIKDICVICGSTRKTVKQTKIHKLLRICEKHMAQKLLNASKLFKDRVYTETVAMREPEDVFTADLYYQSYCCKDYFNKYNTTIEEILKNLDAEDSVTASDESLKAQFLALGLNFDSTAHSLTSIRDTLN